MRVYVCGSKTGRGCGLEFATNSGGATPTYCADCKPLMPRARARSESRLLAVLAAEVAELRVALEQTRGAVGMGNLRLARAVLDNFDPPGRAA